MEQPLSYYVEEIYNRAYYLFLAANSLRSTTSSGYLTDEQKMVIAKPMLEQAILESQGMSDRADEIYQHFYPADPAMFSSGVPPLPVEAEAEAEL